MFKPSRGVVETLGVNPFYQRHMLIRRNGVKLKDLATPWGASGVDYLKLVAGDRGARWNEVVEPVRLLKVDEYWYKGIRGYSSGMRKRIVLIQALIRDPEVVLLDGPYTLIEMETIANLNRLLLEKLRAGTTVLVSTHVFTPIEQHADALTVLFNGRVIYHGDKSKLASESVYVCRKEGFSAEELAYIVEKAREVYADEEVIKVKLAGEHAVNKILVEKCSKLVDTKRVYEKTLGISKPLNGYRTIRDHLSVAWPSAHPAGWRL